MNSSSLPVTVPVAPRPKVFIAPENLITLPETFNYIGAFLTFRCPYSCSYCINRFGDNTGLRRRELPGAKWINFFSRLACRDIPITLQGGEPGTHPDFMEIVAETSKIHHVDILTNLAFDLHQFTKRIDPSLLNRDAPYAPIRVSYHPEQFQLHGLLSKVKHLMDAGFRVGIYGVTHPSQIAAIEHAQTVCNDLGIDFRTKPFLGWHEGTLHGDIGYPGACSATKKKKCECAPSELLLAPDGAVHRCHHHLYHNVDAAGQFDDENLAITDDFHPCSHYGHCNPCDVKVKNNRFQQFGHVSMRIRNVE